MRVKDSSSLSVNSVFVFKNLFGFFLNLRFLILEIGDFFMSYCVYLKIFLRLSLRVTKKRNRIPNFLIRCGFLLMLMGGLCFRNGFLQFVFKDRFLE